MGRKAGYVWVKDPSAMRPKFKPHEKEKILNQVQQIIDKSEKLTEKVSRVSMKGHRVYLYHMVEQFIPEGVIDKYMEFPYVRLTLRNVAGTTCSADWQRPNDQWITIYEGTLEECLHNVEEDEAWFA